MRGLPALALLVALSGCGLLKAKRPEVRQYRLDYPSPVIDAPQLPVVVRVGVFDVVDMYNREAIVYREGTHEMGTYAGHRWLTTPPRMISQLLVRDMVASELYEAVVQGTAPLLSHYEVGGHVERMDEETIAEVCAASLAVRVLLVRSGGGSAPLYQRSYAASSPCAAPGAVGFVEAMSEAASSVSIDVQRDVYAAIARDLRATEVAAE